MYGDDTTIKSDGKNFNNLAFEFNEDLKNVSKWLIANKLSLNVTKTEFMIKDKGNDLKPMIIMK